MVNLVSSQCAVVRWKGGKTQVPAPMGDTTPIPVEMANRPAIYQSLGSYEVLDRQHDLGFNALFSFFI